MADIFLSYAREDEARARLLAAALESQGWSVWWDRRIPHGKDFNAYIQQQLDDARCIVVLWSQASVSSQFVRDEATEGLGGRLVPALIEAVKQPLGFRQLQAADLTDWEDRPTHEEFDRLISSIAALVPPAATAFPSPPRSESRPSKPAPSGSGGRSQGVGRKDVTLAGTDRHAKRILGIDFGVTNTAAAVVESGEPIVIPNAEGGRLTPSIVALAGLEWLIGQRAKRQALTNPENTILGVTRFMGLNYNEVVQEAERVSYRVVPADDGDVRVMVGKQRFSAPDISATVLKTLRDAAETFLGSGVTDAVMTVPAYFNDAQRQATRDAGRLAGFNVRHIVNEPTAAVLAYGLEKRKGATVAVYHLGGGTFDISILEIGDGVVDVKAVNGDTHLGGDDLDQRIVDWMIAEFRNTDGVDLNDDPMARQRMKEAAERAKMELSVAQTTAINLPYITADQRGPKHLAMRLTRTQFEQLVEDLLRKTVGPTLQALSDAGVRPSKIDDVVLAGGSTRIPRVRQLVRGLFGDKPRIRHDVPPEEVACIGAAVFASRVGVGS